MSLNLYHHLSSFSSLILISLILGSCQGTEWGQKVEQSVQVTTPIQSASPEISDAPIPNTQSTFSSPPLKPSPFSSLIPSSQPIVSANSRFTDLAEASLAQSAIRDLDQLGVFESITGSQFDPNRSVKRGEFARWIVRANNAIHHQDPSRQIRLGRITDKPIFLDVPEDDENFIYIQALAAAGFITGDQNQEFRPQSLLSRAELIRLKLLIELSPGELKGTLDQVRQEWGFTDADQIPLATIPAIVADRELEENSTILRTFGPIRVFKPQDPVTRSEVALALSVFGDQTAHAALKTFSSPLPTPPEPSLIPTPEVISIPSPSPTFSPEPSPISSPSPSPSNLDPIRITPNR
jgi:hypothetical protein